MREKDLDYNLKTLEKYIRKAAEDGAELLLLPETCNIGSLCVVREEILPYSEPVPGKSTRFFSNLCKELNVSIAFGMVEHDLSNDLIYNTVVLLNRNGTIAGTYRKAHLFSTETSFLVPGNTGFPVFDTEFGKIGINICEDTVHFESARLTALQGADVLLMSTCWVDNGPDDAWRARAAENGIYMICADWWNTNDRGEEYGGGSCIINPEGIVINEMKFGDGYVIAEIDTDRICRDEILMARRKGKYHWLLQDSYLWGNDGQKLPAPAVSLIGIFPYQAETEKDYVKIAREKLYVHQTNGMKLIVLPSFYKQDVSEFFIEQLQNIIPENLEEELFVAGYQNGGRRYTCLFQKKRILLNYETIHSFPENKFEEGDNEFQTVDTPMGRIGLLGDADLFFPEAARCMARKGADVICISGCWERSQMFLLNEKRRFSDCALLLSSQDSEGVYAYFGTPYAVITEEKDLLKAELDTGNDIIRNKIDIRKARIDLYEGLLTYGK